MFLSLLRKFRVSMILALCAFPMAAGVWATDTPPPTVTPCVNVSLHCTDAPSPGAPIELYGVVTNCSTDLAEWVSVSNYFTGEVYVDWVLLGPGRRLEFSADWMPDPYQCPARGKVRAEAYTEDWSVSTDDLGYATCDCSTMTEICRTPGFWGLRAGEEKKDSQNITQAVIDAAPAGIMVCGETVDNTGLDLFGSALEAMCLHVNGEQVLQLARHLTAAALNCVISGSPIDCEGTGIAGLFAHCDDVCTIGTDPDEIDFCGKSIDCWNNGGVLLESGICQLGVCAHDGAPCEKDENCGYDLEGTVIECIPFTDTCHYQPLVNEALGLDFEPPGPASSSKACNEAIKNDCNLFDGCDD